MSIEELRKAFIEKATRGKPAKKLAKKASFESRLADAVAKHKRKLDDLEHAADSEEPKNE